MADNGKGDPSFHCIPVGLVKLYTSPFYRKFVQTPGLVLMLSEFDGAGSKSSPMGRPLPEEMQARPLTVTRRGSGKAMCWWFERPGFTMGCGWIGTAAL